MKKDILNQIPDLNEWEEGRGTVTLKVSVPVCQCTEEYHIFPGRSSCICLISSDFTDARISDIRNIYDSYFRRGTDCRTDCAFFKLRCCFLYCICTDYFCNHTGKKTYCGKEEHVHLDICYTQVEETAAKKMICQDQEMVLHTHDEICFAEDGTLACTLAEVTAHKVTNWLLIVIFLAGIGLLLYPSLSDYWNSFHQSQAIASYVEKVNEMSSSETFQLLTEAEEYNKKLISNQGNYRLKEEELKEYESILNIGGNGIMGYIDIPSIDCYLPIYHGTDAAILQVAIGHLEWSSLPVGGESSHCVISGHRGLPSAKLFTDLDRLVVGDTFMMRVLDETLTYQVDQIKIVLPEELDYLKIQTGEDYCTLVTCTPYGINSHRLLVRGHRIENLPDAVTIVSDGVRIDPVLVAPIVSIPILLILLIMLLLPKKKKNKKAFFEEDIL